MKKLVTMLLLVVGIMALAGCKTDDPAEVDCTLNPEHEDCAELDFCELYPDDASCNMVYTYEDSYDLLDIENDQMDDDATVYALMNDLVSESAVIFDVAEEHLFESFYSTQVNSETGLTKEELTNYEYPENILLSGINHMNLSIVSEVAHFQINLNEDDELIEDEVVEALIFENINGKSSVFVNEDGFHYLYEVETVDNPGEIWFYYEMTLVVTEEERLVFEIVEYVTSDESGFDYSYIIYDSEVGYIAKDLNYYDETLAYFESQVDINEKTSEMKEINLGGYRTYTYSLYDNEEEFYYRKKNTKSQIGNYYELSKISFYDDFHEMSSFVKDSEFVDEAYVPTNYHISYNIAYLDDWDIVYEDYLIKNNSEIAYVSTRDIYSTSQLFMKVELEFDQLPLENEFVTPYSGIAFGSVAYSELISEMDTVSAMANPVYYDENIATVKGLTYDIRTDLLDLFVSDLPQIVYDNLMEHMIVDEISFGGEDALIDLIDCDVTPDHRLCPDPE